MWRISSHCVSVQIEVVFVALDQCGSSNDRRIALIDKNRDLYLTSVRTLGRAHSIHKIGKSTVQSGICIKAWFVWTDLCDSSSGSMVDTMAWNDSANILCGIQDSRFTVWYYPGVVFVDKDLLPKTIFTKDSRYTLTPAIRVTEACRLHMSCGWCLLGHVSCSEFSRPPQMVSYEGTQVTVRRVDGSLVCTAVSPYPSLLHEYTGSGRWEDALRICRFAKVSGSHTAWRCTGQSLQYLTKNHTQPDELRTKTDPVVK